MLLKDDLVNKTNLFRINEVFTKTIMTPVGSILVQYGKNKVSDTTYKLKFQYKFLVGSVAYRREEVYKGRFVYDNLDSYESVVDYINTDMYIDNDSLPLLKMVYMIDKAIKALDEVDKDDKKHKSKDDSNEDNTQVDDFNLDSPAPDVGSMSSNDDMSDISEPLSDDAPKSEPDNNSSTSKSSEKTPKSDDVNTSDDEDKDGGSMNGLF